MTETIIFLRKLLECTSGISLHHIPYNKADLLTFLQDCTSHVFDALLEQDSAYWKQLLQMPMQENTIYEYLALGGITFMVYRDKERDSLFFLGPALTQPFSKEDTLHSICQYPIPDDMKPHILHYCSTLPVIPGHALYRAADLLVAFLTGKEQPTKIVQGQVLSPIETQLLNSPFAAGGDIVQMRQVEMRYEYSAALTDAIKQGNLSLALHMIGQSNPDSQNPVRNSNPLRNAQNYCIVLNTQLRHAMEETGVHPYRVDKLSHEIGLEIEQLKSIAQLHSFFISVVRRYCRLVQEYDYPNLKPLINLTVTYIKEHLADNLTVKDTAKALTVNANYLSSLFHKEMGITFIDFVNKERTRQALGLLVHTNLQIQQIASMVGYNNTSYFTKQFLRFQGVTPSHYRKGMLL